MSAEKKEKQQIVFSYTFHDSLERVYSAFAGMSENIESTYSKFVDKLTIEKGEAIDEDDTTFSIDWKGHYLIQFITSECDKTDTIRKIKLKTLKIGKFANASFICTLSFHWNTCENNTLLLIQFEFPDEFGKELLEEELTNDEVTSICSDVESYLQDSLVGVSQIESVFISSPINNVWNVLNDLENVLFFCYIGFPYKISVCNEEENENAGRAKGFFVKGKRLKIFKEKNDAEVLIAYVVVKEVHLSERRKEVAFECTEEGKEQINLGNKRVPKQLIQLRLDMLNEKHCMVFFKHYPEEYVPVSKLSEVSLVKQKILKNIKTRLEQGRKDSSSSHSSSNVSLSN